MRNNRITAEKECAYKVTLNEAMRQDLVDALKIVLSNVGSDDLLRLLEPGTHLEFVDGCLENLKELYRALNEVKNHPYHMV